MRANERENWVANNVGKGGKKSSYSQFNKEFKGKERNPEHHKKRRFSESYRRRPHVHRLHYSPESGIP